MLTVDCPPLWGQKPRTRNGRRSPLSLHSQRIDRLPAPVRRGRQVRPGTDVMSAEPRTARRTRTPQLVERDSELAELSERLEAVRAGAGSVVVIEGPAGVGKSALLDFACGRASDRDIRVLTGRGSEFEQAYPWGVVRALFAPALGVSDAEREQAARWSGAARRRGPGTATGTRGGARGQPRRNGGGAPRAVLGARQSRRR